MTVDTNRSGMNPDFLAGGGEMGAIMRRHDWTASPLGPTAGWPQSLRAIVALMINSKHPMFVAWGPELAFLYNDGYRPIFGAKHPAALGLPFRQVWSEIWDDIWPLIERALSGEATWSEDLHLVMHRNGYPEDTWYTFSYSPVRDESGRIAGMFCACTETTQKVLAERRSQAERERLERMFAQAPGFMAMLRGPEHRFELANPAYLRLVGHRDILGRTLAEALPDAAAQGYGALLDRVHRSGEAYRSTGAAYHVQTVPGGPVDERFVDFVYQPLTDSSGAVSGVFVEGYDVTERIRAEAALRDSEARFRNMADHAPVMIWVTDADASCTYLSRSWYEFTGQTEAEGLGFGWLDATHPEDRAGAERVFTEANVAGTAFRLEYRLRRTDGVYRWAIDAAQPRFGEDGRFLGYIGSVIDITDRKDDEQQRERLLEHQQLLIHELNHRVRNTLSIVQSLAAQTFAADASPQAREAFEGRLLSLAQAHDLLTRESWESASLADVARLALEPYAEAGHAGRVTVAGPHLRLSPRTAIVFGMAFHELATNAAKYGALSTERGTVSVTWTQTQGRVGLQWRESGGPRVRRPGRRGFGSRLIERNLARELDGDVVIEFAPDGVICRMDMPVPEPEAATLAR